MSKSISKYSTIVLIVWTILSLSCSMQAAGTREETVAPAGTATPLPVTANASPTPAPTLTPTDTPVPSPTPIPWTSQPISAENAKELQEINRWGRGSPLQIRLLHGDSERFLVLTDFGVYLYQTAPVSDQLAFIPDVRSFYLSQDEQFLAVSLKNGDVQVWNMDDMSLKQTFTHKFPEDIVKKIEEDRLLPFYVGGIAFSPDNSEIAVGYADGAVELFRLGETAPYVTLRHDSFSLWGTDVGLVFELSYSPDGKTLAIFKYEPYVNANRLTLWSLPEGELTFLSEAGRFYDFAKPAYLPDGQTLLVFSRYDSYLYLTTRDIQTGAQLSRFDTDLVEIISTELASDGSQITIYGRDAGWTYFRQVRSLPKGDRIENEKLEKLPNEDAFKRLDELLFEKEHYYNTWYKEDGLHSAKLGVTGDRSFRVLGETHWLMFPEGTKQPLNLPKDVDNFYYDRGEQTLGWCTPGAVHFQDTDGKITTLEVPAITRCDGLVVSPRRHYAVIWYGDTLFLVNLGTAKFTKFSFGLGGTMAFLAARFSSDEKILIVSSPGSITIWQVDTLKKITYSDIGINTGHNIEIVLPKDNSFFVTLNDANDQSKSDSASDLRVWRIEDAFAGRVIRLPSIGDSRPDFTTFVLSPDAKLIASGDDFGGIRIWSVKTGEELAYFDIDAFPLDLAFTPDGSGLLILLGDGTVRLWGVP